ncbi:MAG TPA: lytic transglycosylase domain-containing protein [Stellaceae bacterium]|nr:lytic transglycosylase domain-containing protein [Stellaceae bacterium]
MRVARLALAVSALALAAIPARAADIPGTCRIIEQAAAANRLPIDMLTRLIWIESHFQSGATSPAGAEGIAQFMPETAAARGLADPRDPEAAIPHAARLLVDLRRRFGNVGLAAAAYNAGAARVAKWLQAAGGLPLETRLYVKAVTGVPAEQWVGAGDFPPAPGRSCAELIAQLDRRGQHAAPREAIWQTKLDGGLSRAIALLASIPAAPPARAPARRGGGAAALCASIRALGANCAVYDR